MDDNSGYKDKISSPSDNPAYDSIFMHQNCGLFNLRITLNSPKEQIELRVNGCAGSDFVNNVVETILAFRIRLQDAFSQTIRSMEMQISMFLKKEERLVSEHTHRFCITKKFLCFRPKIITLSDSGLHFFPFFQ